MSKFYVLVLLGFLLVIVLGLFFGVFLGYLSVLSFIVKCFGYSFFCGVVSLGMSCFLKGCWYVDYGFSDGVVGSGLSNMLFLFCF